ncbi:hypothetical protein [Gimesia panareensis]|uniref:hypothetical protein n=1 Tax=Gimesia panareensis TaxID=2527978 RepID=UPI001188C3EB|nr:hypothetical protein [Gimesia panareensis]QDU52666.1 hypothetical protein Pan110_50460 [Gimesia panareensis]
MKSLSVLIGKLVLVNLLWLFIFSLVSPVIAGNTPDHEPFQLSFEADEKDPRLCRVVVTAADKRFWVTLQHADEERFQQVLSLKRESKSAQKLPPMLGRYELKDQRLEFKPAFPLVRGGRYQATFTPGALNLPTKLHGQLLQRTYAIPLPDAKPPRVVSIYPSGKQLPANHLKFYIQFSEPMQQGDIFPNFSLYNKTQKQLVPRPFRHTELWSPDGKQLTLWFHPGRQKTGVNLNVELGAILNAGQEYELRINPKWAALSGHPLGKEIKKSFSAVAMDERQPEPETWKLKTPDSGKRNPLFCELGETLDYALLHSQLRVQTLEGKPVPGKIELAAHESVWKFLPEKPWQPGRYQLVIGTVLEDLAGNSLQQPFAIDLTKQQTASNTVGEFVTLGFEIK